MKRLMLTAAVAGLTTYVAQSQVLLSGGLTYSQNFDSLASSSTTTTVPWADNTTLPGWYASRAYTGGTSTPFGPYAYTSYRVSGGEQNNGWIYSFGTNGVGLITDRALGSVSSGTPKTNVFGVRLQNNTADILGNVLISYTGEQWRNGGNTSLAAQTLLFSFQVSSTPFTSPIGTDNGGNWSQFAALNFTSPIVSATGGALDGNDPANRTQFSNVLLTDVTINPGDEIFLRWLDIDDSGNDHGLGVDDLSVSFSTVVPEPSTAALSLLGLVGLWIRRRK